MTDLRILVVCLGNRCRSPLAERLLRHRLTVARHAGSVSVVSAGVEAPSGASMDPLATAELGRLGGDAIDFTSRRLSPAMVDAADLVLTATRELRTRTVALQPRALKRAFTLSELAALCEALPSAPDQPLAGFLAEAAHHRQTVARLELDLADPIGRPPAVHREVADRIDRDVAAIVARLVPLFPPPLVDVSDPALHEFA